MNNQYKYLTIAPLPTWYAALVTELMDAVAVHTGIPAPHHSLPPRLTLHAPVSQMSEMTMQGLVKNNVAGIQKTELPIGGRIYTFGKHYLVLPVLLSTVSARFLIQTNMLVYSIPHRLRSEYQETNTLHVTIAAKTSHVFDVAWPRVRTLAIRDQDSVEISELQLYRKQIIDGAQWELLNSYTLH